MKPFLNCVAICGADDQIPLSDLQVLYKEFPFMEWGLMLYKFSGGEGYPTYGKIVELLESGMPCCAHLCSKWVEEINWCGSWTVLSVFPRLYEVRRFQINFAGKEIETNNVIRSINSTRLKHQIILQVSSFDHPVLNDAPANVAAFFDASHGKGKLPEQWPKARENRYCGYAGGLNPDNLAENLEKISQVANTPAWVDVQSGVMTNRRLDLDKAHKFLTIAKPWIL